MTEVGLAKINYPVADDGQDIPKPAAEKQELAVPRGMKQTPRVNSRAGENFWKLAPSYRRNSIRWTIDAKQVEMRKRLPKEAIACLAQNKKLGVK